MKSTSMLRVGICLGIGLLVSSCAWLPFAPRAIGACDGALRPSEAIETDVMLRMRLRATSGEIDLPLQLIAQSHAGQLILIGVNPFGAKVFTIIQKGIETEVDAAPSALLAIDPLNVLRDLHRARFFAAPMPSDGEGPAHGRFGSTEVRDQWRAGEIERRSLIDTETGRETGRIDFSGRTAIVHHPACDYTLLMETLSVEPIRSD